MPQAPDVAPALGREDLELKPNGKKWNARTSYEYGYAQEAIDLMKQGYSKHELALHFEVSCKTLERWALNFPDFAEAFDHGKDYRKAWYDEGLRAMMGEKFDMKGYTHVMAVDYGISDKAPQINLNVEANAENDELIEKVSKMLKQMHKDTI